MDADQHENNNKNNDNNVVTSVGNSWIICRSKSYSGRVYYFNTHTGEAAWNLSDSEIEKAKRRTNSLQNTQGVLIESCPEPKEPPMDQSTNGSQNRNNMEQKSIPSKIYNKQIINNRFTKPAYPFPPFATPGTHSVAPTCGCLNPGAPMGLSHTTPSCNHSVWTVPPSHQIFIAPTPLVSHPHTSSIFNAIEDNVDVHNSTVPLSRRFQMKKPPEYNKSFPKKHFVKTNKHDRYGYRREGNFQRSCTDLRQLLSSKRTQRNYEQSVNEEQETEGIEHINDSFMNNSLEEEPQPNITTTKHKEDSNEDNYQSDADNDWLEDNISFKGTKLHLDVTNIKMLAKANAKADCWYIAVDKTILTSHLHFLNILINSDDQCHLMVPQKVLDELRVKADTSRNMPRLRRRARRAVDFLSQQLEAGSAMIGTDATEADNENDYIINCCRNLVQSKYHVVLLSNQTELGHYKTSSQFPIFSISKLKMFLSSNKEDKEPSPGPSSEPSKNPISNDLHHISNESLLSNTQETHSGMDIVTKNNFSEPQYIKDKEIYVQQNETVNQFLTTYSRQTVDAEVQTEITPLPKVSKTIVSSKRLSDCPQADLVNNIQPSSNRVMTLNCSVEANDAVQVNRSKRQIRLKRSRPQVSIGIDNNVEKKQFKWRKRRDGNSTQTNEYTLPSTSNSDSGQPSSFDLTSPQDQFKTAQFDQSEKSNTEVNVGTQLAHQMSFDSLSQESNNVDENILGSETSSCVFVHRNIGDITIEETSTSGVISNTSIGNSDCGSIPKVQLISNKSVAQKDESAVENRMFEVTNQAIEDYLKMRCDEWVSRFVQIMEEVLAQVLHQDPSFLKAIPPPCNLHEAAQCIKMKFSKDINIVDASTKLTQVLFEISAKRGRINDMRPSEFLEMYSYGVYLINALQSAMDSCEDLHTASEYLSLLWRDIQNPNADCSHNETFGDNPHYISATTSLAASTFESNVHKNNSNLENTTFDSYAQINESNLDNNTFESYVLNTDSNLGSKGKRDLDNDFSDTKQSEKYNLRSKKRKFEGEKQKQQSGKFVRKVDIESTFFTGLNLQKNSGEEVTKPNNTDTPLLPSNDKELSSKSQTISPNKTTTEQATESQLKKNTAGTSQSISPSKTTTHNRNKFTNCSQYESQLKKNTTVQSIDVDKLKNSANFEGSSDDDKYTADNYCSEDDYYDSEENDPVIEEANERERRGKSLDLTVETDDNNNNVIVVLKSFIKEIIETLMRVRRFCDQIRNGYTLSEPTQSRKDEIHKKLERAQLDICNLCKSLSSLFYRESSESENTLHSLLGKAGLHNVDLNEKQFSAYRDIVANCIDNANTLLEFVNLIITTVKT